MHTVEGQMNTEGTPHFKMSARWFLNWLLRQNAQKLQQLGNHDGNELAAIFTSSYLHEIMIDNSIPPDFTSKRLFT